MENVVLVIHLFLALSLIAVILLQPTSEGGGLTSSSSSMSGFMTPRGSANLLTRTTIILALAFMGTSLALVVISGMKKPTSVLDNIDTSAAVAPETAASEKLPVPPVKKSAPAKTAPSVPTGN